MKKEECYLAGKIIRAHGVKGDLQVFLDVDDPKRYKKMKSLLVEKDGGLISYDVTKVSILNNIAIVHLAEIDTMTRAEELLKCDVYLPLSFLPELDEKNFYFHEVINYKVVDKDKGEIGIFEKVYGLPHQNIAQIKQGDKEILIPVIKNFIERIDRKEKTLYLDLPEGLIDVYLNP
ncbi:MAG: ribosome maturation factor RimM [Bacteroidia bacterium]